MINLTRPSEIGYYVKMLLIDLVCDNVIFLVAIEDIILKFLVEVYITN